MKDHSRERPEVIGTPERAIEVWAEESNYTEAGAAAGVPVPSAATQLALTATGAQTVAIDIRTQDGGIPALDSTAAGVHAGATFLCKLASDTEWLGHNPPYGFTRWEPIQASFSVPEFILDPDVTVTDDGVVVVAADVRDSSVSPQYVLRVYRRNPDDGSWSIVDVASQTTAPLGRKPALMLLPSGRLHLYEWVGDSFPRLWYSDDSGLTWSHGGDKIVDYGITGSTAERCRVAYSEGQCLMLVDVDTGGTREIVQYASSDLGLTFQRVTVEGGTGDAALGDVTSRAEGGFVVVAAEITSTAGANAYVLSDAFQAFTRATPVALSSSMGDTTTGVQDDDDLCVVRDETGLLYAYGRIDDAMYASLSYDGGLSWVDFRLEVFTGLRFPSAGDRLTRYAAAVHRGRVVLVHLWTVGTAAWASGVGIAYIGGWTRATHPAVDITQTAGTVIGWRYMYVPLELPGNAGWTMAGAGSESITTTIGRLTMTTAANTRTAAITPATNDGRWRVVVVPTCTTVGDQRFTYSNGTMQVSIRMSATSWELWDDLAGARIGAAVAGSWASTGLEVWIEMDITETATQAWYRVPSTSEAAEWLAGPTSTTVTTGAPVAVIRWGHEVAHSATSEWLEIAWDDTSSAALRTVPLVVPTGLRGRELAGTPYTVAKTTIAARGGPTWRGEQWSVPTRATYRLQQSIETPSPRIAWRSTTAEAQTIAIRWDDSGPTRGPSDVLALSLRDHNITRMTVEYYDGSSWVALRTLFDPGVTGLSWTRTGRSVRPGATGTRTYLTHGEYAGGVYICDGDARRIDSHSEGVWDSAYPLQPRLRLEGDVSTVATSGTDGVIIPSEVLLILDLTGINAQAVRIVLPDATSAAATEPPEGYWQIGSLGAYWLHPVGHESEWGAVKATTANNETLTTRDRQARITKVAPPARSVSVTWEAVHQVEVEVESALPGYLALGGTLTPSASGHGTAYVLDGVYQEANGDELTLLYLPACPALTPGGVTVLYRRRDFIGGRITSGGIQRTNVVGDHGRDELVSVGAITLTEDP